MVRSQDLPPLVYFRRVGTGVSVEVPGSVPLFLRWIRLLKLVGSSRSRGGFTLWTATLALSGQPDSLSEVEKDCSSGPY